MPRARKASRFARLSSTSASVVEPRSGASSTSTSSTADGAGHAERLGWVAYRGADGGCHRCSTVHRVLPALGARRFRTVNRRTPGRYRVAARAPSSTVEQRTLNPQVGWFESPGAHQLVAPVIEKPSDDGRLPATSPVGSRATAPPHLRAP